MIKLNRLETFIVVIWFLCVLLSVIDRPRIEGKYMADRLKEIENSLAYYRKEDKRLRRVIYRIANELGQSRPHALYKDPEIYQWERPVLTGD